MFIYECPNCKKLYYDGEGMSAPSTCDKCWRKLRRIDKDTYDVNHYWEDHVIGEYEIPKENPYQVHCPLCGSPDCNKVGAISRTLSIGFWGLSSNKINKQWRCNNCKSYF